MTTYQSQTVYTVDREGNSLAFSTVNEPGEESVLKAAVDIEMPDGQRLPMSVLYNESDVQGLLAYLHDNFGRGVQPLTKAQANAMLDEHGTLFPEPSGDLQYYADQDGMAAAGAWQPKPGDTVHVVTATVNEHQTAEVRQCPVIYNGVQCARAEGHHDSQDQPDYHEFPGSSFLPQNDAGAVPPPADVQGVASTPQPALTGQSAAESATAAGTAEAAPASTPAEPKKRKRRTKLEIAFDTAMEKWGKGDGDAAQISDEIDVARKALAAKDPSNPRLSQFAIPTAGTPAPVPTEMPVGFAPEQPAVGEAWAAPNNYFQQANHPVVQEMAQQFGGYDTEQTVAGPWSQRPDGAAEYNVLNAAAQEATQAYQAGGQVLIDAANNAGYDVPGFQPGQAQELGTVTVAPEEQAAAQAFPCPVQSSDGRPCQRPYGHEIQTATNPQPKPHVYATIPSQLGVPAQPAPLSFQVPPTPEQPQQPGFQPPAPAAPSWAEPV